MRVAKLLHDLNQPLSAIGNYAQAGHQLVANGMTDVQRLDELFVKILAQCNRATELSRELGDAVKALPPGPDQS